MFYIWVWPQWFNKRRMEADTRKRKTSNTTGKCQNITPISGFIFAGCFVMRGKNNVHETKLWAKNCLPPAF